MACLNRLCGIEESTACVMQRRFFLPDFER